MLKILVECEGLTGGREAILRLFVTVARNDQGRFSGDF